MNFKTLQAAPICFRDALRIDCDGTPKRLGDVVEDWQQDDFARLDPAWRSVVGKDVECLRRAWLERPRGHSKTSDIAVMVCWALFAARRSIKDIATAADRDQAGILRDQIAKLVRSS